MLQGYADDLKTERMDDLNDKANDRLTCNETIMTKGKERLLKIPEG